MMCCIEDDVRLELILKRLHGRPVKVMGPWKDDMHVTDFVRRQGKSMKTTMAIKDRCYEECVRILTRTTWYLWVSELSLNDDCDSDDGILDYVCDDVNVCVDLYAVKYMAAVMKGR